MEDFIRKNAVLISAFAIPVLIIIGVVASALLPSLTMPKNYNFVYATCSVSGPSYNSNCNGYLLRKYVVSDGRVLTTDIPTTEILQEYNTSQTVTYQSHLFLHDVMKNESRELSLEEIEKLRVNEMVTSPEGTVVSYINGMNSTPFGGHSGYGYYLTKGKGRMKLDLLTQNNYYDSNGNYHFIGWDLNVRK